MYDVGTAHDLVVRLTQSVPDLKVGYEGALE
jgi:hypothetical protein